MKKIFITLYLLDAALKEFDTFRNPTGKSLAKAGLFFL